MSTALDLLRLWLRRQLPQAASAWLEEQLAKLGAAAGDRDLYIALGLVPRKLGKADLELSDGRSQGRRQGARRAGTRAAGASIRRRAS